MVQSISVLFAFIAIFSLSFDLNAADGSKRVIVGLIEQTRIEPDGFRIQAKVDTGAATTSIDARNVQQFDRQGNPWVRFSVINKRGEEIILERPVIRMASIRRAGTVTEERPVVPLDICVGNISKRIGVNLARREGMDYRMLIGCNYLDGSHLVDPSVDHLTTPQCL
jgi:hypothetical protein